MPNEYRIIHYKNRRNKDLIEGYLDKLDIKTRAKIMAYITLLKERNITLRMPYAKKIKGEKDLWELRIKLFTNIHRIFYFAYSGKNIVLLHCFRKKEDKTPKQEITRAKNCLLDFLKRRNEFL